MIRYAGFAVLLFANWGVAEPPKSSRLEQLRFDSQQGMWVEIARPEPDTAAGDLAVAREQFVDARYSVARKSMRRWMKRYGDGDAVYPAALLLVAQIDKGLGNFFKAGQTLDELIEAYPGIAESREALVELFNIAEVFLTGVRRKVWGMRLLRTEDWALDVLDRISTEFVNDPLAELAVKTKADYYYAHGDYSLAELEYARIVQEFSASRYRQYSMRRASEAAVASFNGVLFDDAPLIEAEERFREYVRDYPGIAEQEGVSLRLQDIREKRAAKEYEVGDYYERTGHRDAAAYYYNSVRTHWPDTLAARRAAGALSALPGGQQAPEEFVGPPLENEGGVR